MLSEKIVEMLNKQIKREIDSAYIYLNIANYYNNEGLNGFENWFYVQSKEELDHAMLFRTFLLNNDVSVKLMSIDPPKDMFSSFEAPLKTALQHEKYITSSINKIYETATEEKDYATIQFLNWFIKEQQEEEKSAKDLIRKYELFGNNTNGLYQLDEELKSRVYSAPDLTL